MKASIRSDANAILELLKIYHDTAGTVVVAQSLEQSQKAANEWLGISEDEEGEYEPMREMEPGEKLDEWLKTDYSDDFTYLEMIVACVATSTAPACDLVIVLSIADY